MKYSTLLSKLGILALVTCVPTLAHAQAQATAQGGVQTGVQGQTQVGMQLPGTYPQTTTALPPPGVSDHDAVVGRWAVGYLGRRGVEVGVPNAIAGFPNLVEAPVIGIRYWLDRMVGIDAGVGIRLQGGDGLRQTAFVLHGGVPLSLASAGHFSFQIVPELNLGFGSQSVDNPAAGVAEWSARGFLLEAGARAGAEIHFGFMGVPQLSLQGSVGAGLGFSSVKTSVRNTAGVVVSSPSADSFYFATSYRGGDNPWDIFTANVAALYYF